MLPQFDLSQLIQNVNQTRARVIREGEHFGFPFFKRSLLNACQAMIARINDSAHVFIFSDWEGKYLIDRSKTLKIWKAPISTSSESLELTEKLYREYKKAHALPSTLIEKKALYRWREKHYRLFQNTDDWSTLTKRDIDLAKLDALKVSWQRQALFARHNHQAISEIAFNLLPHLIEHHKQALENIKWYYFFIPTPIYTAYKSYAQDFLVKAQLLQQALAASMFARLKVWDESGFKHADIMLHLADQLGIEHPPAREELTPEQFSTFHHYIEQHGNDVLRQRLGELSWVRSPLFPLTTVQSENVRFWVPPLIEKDVPSRIRKPNWLFKRANLRYLLCEKHSLDFIRLQQLQDITRVVIDISKPDELRRIVQLIGEKQQLSAKLYAETQAKPYIDLGFTEWRTRRFLNNYRASLQSYYQKTLGVQLNLAEKMMQQLTEGMDALTVTAVAPCLTYEVLSQLLERLQKQVEGYGDSVLQEKFTQLQGRSEAVLSAHQMVRDLHHLAKGEPLSPEAFATLKEFLMAQSSLQNGHLQKSLQSLMFKFAYQLTQELKRDPKEFSQEKASLRHICYVQQLYDVLKSVAPSQLDQRFSDKVTRYFLSYLNELVSCGTTKHTFQQKQCILETFEQVLNQLPCTKDIRIDTNSLSHYVKKLIDLRKANQFIELKVEAQALSLLLGEDCLIRRVNKDCQILDRQIIDWLTADLKSSCSDEILQLAWKLRNAAAEFPELSMDEVAEKLKFTTTEKVLIGLKTAPKASKKDEVIPELMELSSRSLLLQRSIEKENLHYGHKLQQVRDFSSYLEQTLSRLRNVYLLPKHLGQTNRASPLFFKTYSPDDPESLSTDVLPSNSMPTI